MVGAVPARASIPVPSIAVAGAATESARATNMDGATRIVTSAATACAPAPKLPPPVTMTAGRAIVATACAKWVRIPAIARLIAQPVATVGAIRVKR
jgi:hypothetical protein